jgi:carnitine O-acetyltransferase
MYCLVQRQLQNNTRQETQSTTTITTTTSSSNGLGGPCSSSITKMPSIYTDPGWALLGTSILSTSNCGNPALRLFGFGPVAADGYGIGYIIKEDGISVYEFPFLPSFPLSYSKIEFAHFSQHPSCASSKHLQTRRFLDTLQGYLLDIQRLLIQLHRSANERPAPFVDHLGILRDSKTGRPINGTDEDEDEEEVAMREFFSFISSHGGIVEKIE